MRQALLYCVLLQALISPDLDSLPIPVPQAPNIRISPDNGHLLIPQGPNYLDTTTNQMLQPIGPDMLLNPQTGGIIFVPDGED